MKKNSKHASFIGIRNVLFSEIGIGLTANTILLLFHVHIFLRKHRTKPIDLTCTHLALVHIVMLLTGGFLEADIFDSQNTWDDTICKSLVFLQRLMRSLSIGTTCLLSVTQAVTLSLRSSPLVKFKCKSSQSQLCCLGFLWILNMFTNGYFLVFVVSSTNVTMMNPLFVTESCSLLPLNYFLSYMLFTVLACCDAFLLGLMTLSSGYMVTILCRHKWQTQHLHSTRLSPRASPEGRATQTILWLMTFFVVMYFMDCVISCSASRKGLDKNPIHMCVQMFVGNVYATISPLVLVSMNCK